MPYNLTPDQQDQLDALRGATISLFDTVLVGLNRLPLDGENFDLEETITRYGFTITVKIQIKT